jgi:RNA polymerase sigma-70 factor (ECF subfamily)
MIEVRGLVGDSERAPLPDVFAELAPRVRRLALRRLGEDRADDVVQETFLRAYRAYDRYVEDGRSWAWLRNIAEHVCVDMARRSRIEASAVERVRSYGRVVAVDETFASVAAREERSTMATVLAQLHPRQRRVLVLRDVQGWTTTEVAAALGMTIEGVKATLKRARCAARAAYGGVSGGRYVAGILGAIAAVRRALRRATAATTGSTNVVLVSAIVVVTTLTLGLPVPLLPGAGDGRGGVARSTSSHDPAGYGRRGAGGAAGAYKHAAPRQAPPAAPAAAAPLDAAVAAPRSEEVVLNAPGATPASKARADSPSDVAGRTPGPSSPPPALEVGTDLSPTCGVVPSVEEQCAPLDQNVVVPLPPVEEEPAAPPVALPWGLALAPPDAAPSSRMSTSLRVRSDPTEADDTMEPSPTDSAPVAEEALEALPSLR